MRRRDFMPALAVPVAALAQTASQQNAFDNPSPAAKGDAVLPGARQGRIRQGVTRGVFGNGMDFEEMCRQASRLGIKGFDLIGPADWPVLKKYGLTPSMYQLSAPGSGAPGASGRGIASAAPPAAVQAPAGGRGASGGRGGGRGPAGFNQIGLKEAQDIFLKPALDGIDLAAGNGVPNVIMLAGSRGSLTDEQGQENAVAFLNMVKSRAEDKGVTLCMELISSNKTAPRESRYFFDHAAWGFEVVKRVNSPRVKVLLDLYHLQVMDGDLVRTIRDNFQWIGHFHTGGSPGRNELDDTQEVYYPFVMKSIAELGYTGFVSHEYRPVAGNDPIASLEKCIRICDA
jgi:hydroxypyruvate isomerase